MFIKENVNPKNNRTTDCVVRAISKATRVPYNDVIDLLANKMKETGYAFNEPKGYGRVLEDLGFVKVSCSKVAKGEKRPKVIDIAKMTEGNNRRAVCQLAGHAVAVEKGNVYDTWNCSPNAVYSYYIIEENG